VRARVVAGVLAAGALLAACGTTSLSAPPALGVNFATVRETAAGSLVVEVQGYQHGQVLEATDGALELRTPEGVSTRAGVNLGLTPDGTTVWAAANAEIQLYVTPIFVGPIGDFRAAELQVAVAPFPGALDPESATQAVALIGTRAYGAKDQSLVAITRAGRVAGTLAGQAMLAGAARRAGCAGATYRAVLGRPTDPLLMASCPDRRALVLLHPGGQVVRRLVAPGPILGISGPTVVDGHVEVAVVVDRGSKEELVVFGPHTAVLPLAHRAASSPSLAAGGAYVLVPETDGRSQLVGLGSADQVVLDRAGPRNGQGVGTTLGGRALVVAANPDGDVVSLWISTPSGFATAGRLAIPEGVGG
jgi:hypothetical protein